MTDRNDKIVKDSISIWGREINFNQANEELGELIVAINHYRRDRITELPLIEEMADVSLMIDLLKEIIARDTLFKANEINEMMLKVKQKKIDRLERRLEGKE